MPDTKVALLTQIQSIDASLDFLPIVDVSDTTMAASGTTKKVTTNQILQSGNYVVVPSGSSTQPALSFSNDGNSGIYSPSGDQVSISAGGSGVLTVTNSGISVAGTGAISGNLAVDTSTLFVDAANNRVGIGTATPSVSLDVNGSAYFRDNSAIVGAGKTLEFISTYPNRTQLYQTAGNNFTFDNISSGGFLFYTNSNLRATLDSSGRLGIGTATPAGPLSIVGPDSNFVVTVGGATKGVRFATSSNGTKIEGVDNTFAASYQPLTIGGSVLNFDISNSTKATLDSSGNLGIGTTTPNATLSVFTPNANIATFTRDLATDVSFTIGADNSGVQLTSNLGSIQLWTGGSEKARLNSDGNLGLGVTPSGAYKLEVGSAQSSVFLASTVGYGAASEQYSSFRFHNTSFSGGNSEIRNIVNGSVSLGSSLSFYTSQNGTGALTQRMTIDSSGNLGLGVTPSATTLATLQTAWGHIYGQLQINLAQNVYWNSGWKYYAAAAASYYFQDDGVHAWYSSTDATPVANGTATFGSAKMTLDASGNLGVGVTTVGERIHASGNIKAAGSAGTFPRFISEVGAKSWATGYRSGTTSFEIWEDSTTRLAIANGGQVQVGINGTASVPAIALAANPDTGLYWPTNSDTLALAVGGSDAVYIDANRNVIIGGSSPLNSSAGRGNITINGTSSILNFSISNTEGGYLFHDGTNMSQVVRTNGYLAFSTNNTERLRIKSAGQLNFTGLAADPTGAAGDLYYSTGNALKLYTTAWNTVVHSGNVSTYALPSSGGTLDGALTMGNGYQIRATDGTASSPGISFVSDQNTGLFSGGVDIIGVVTNGTERARVDNNGNVVVGTADLATNATNGFLYIPSCAGTPTGNPAAYSGRVPLVWDSTNDILYVRSGGSWKQAVPAV